jgi:hypothetical protein
MRLTLHFRGKPLLAVDLAAHSPDDEQPDEGPALQAAPALQDAERAEPMEPDTRAIGFGIRPESRGAQ